MRQRAADRHRVGGSHGERAAIDNAAGNELGRTTRPQFEVEGAGGILRQRATDRHRVGGSHGERAAIDNAAGNELGRTAGGRPEVEIIAVDRTARAPRRVEFELHLGGDGARRRHDRRVEMVPSLVAHATGQRATRRAGGGEYGKRIVRDVDLRARRVEEQHLQVARRVAAEPIARGGHGVDRCGVGIAGRWRERLGDPGVVPADHKRLRSAVGILAAEIGRTPGPPGRGRSRAVGLDGGLEIRIDVPVRRRIGGIGPGGHRQGGIAAQRQAMDRIRFAGRDGDRRAADGDRDVRACRGNTAGPVGGVVPVAAGALPGGGGEHLPRFEPFEARAGPASLDARPRSAPRRVLAAGSGPVAEHQGTPAGRIPCILPPRGPAINAADRWPPIWT